MVRAVLQPLKFLDLLGSERPPGVLQEAQECPLKQ